LSRILPALNWLLLCLNRFLNRLHCWFLLSLDRLLHLSLQRLSWFLNNWLLLRLLLHFDYK
jgi:hypothetical protein